MTLSIHRRPRFVAPLPVEERVEVPSSVLPLRPVADARWALSGRHRTVCRPWSIESAETDQSILMTSECSLPF
eukprot:scaffold1482_cov29-Prasinocladus_malaysianus.AAC.1